MKERVTYQINPKAIFQGTEEDARKSRIRRYFVRTYAPFEALATFFDNALHYAYIKHDKDTDDDGKPKAEHGHFIICLKDNKTPTAFAETMAGLAPDEACYIAPLGDKDTAVAYMLHRDAKSVADHKTPYSTEDIISDDLAYFVRTKKEKANAKTKAFFDDLFAGELTKREMAYKYGRDYAKNANHYDAFVKTCGYDEYARSIDNPDNKTSTYTDLLDICERVVRRALHFYLPSNQMPDNAYLEAQIATEFNNVLLAEQTLDQFIKE